MECHKGFDHCSSRPVGWEPGKSFFKKAEEFVAWRHFFWLWKVFFFDKLLLKETMKQVGSYLIIFLMSQIWGFGDCWTIHPANQLEGWKHWIFTTLKNQLKDLEKIGYFPKKLTCHVPLKKWLWTGRPLSFQFFESWPLLSGKNLWPSRQLTAKAPQKWMVGIRCVSFWGPPYFQVLSIPTPGRKFQPCFPLDRAKNGYGFLLLMAEIPNNHLGWLKPYK